MMVRFFNGLLKRADDRCPDCGHYYASHLFADAKCNVKDCKCNGNSIVNNTALKEKMTREHRLVDYCECSHPKASHWRTGEGESIGEKGCAITSCGCLAYKFEISIIEDMEDIRSMAYGRISLCRCGHSYKNHVVSHNTSGWCDEKDCSCGAFVAAPPTLATHDCQFYITLIKRIAKVYGGNYVFGYDSQYTDKRPKYIITPDNKLMLDGLYTKISWEFEGKMPSMWEDPLKRLVEKVLSKVQDAEKLITDINDLSEKIGGTVETRQTA